MEVQDRLYRELIKECFKKSVFWVVVVSVALAVNFVVTLPFLGPMPILKTVLSSISSSAEGLGAAVFSGLILPDADAARKEHRKIRAAGGQPPRITEILSEKFFGSPPATTSTE